MWARVMTRRDIVTKIVHANRSTASARVDPTGCSNTRLIAGPTKATAMAS